MDAKNCGAKSTAKTVKAVSNSTSAKTSGKCGCKTTKSCSGKLSSSAKACSGKMSSSAKACSGKSNTKISNNCKCAK